MDDRGFERVLRDALRREADQLPFRIDAVTVHDRLADRSRIPAWLLPVGLPLAAAVLASVVILNVFPGADGDPGSGAGLSASPSPSQTPVAARSASALPQPTPHPAFGRRRATAYADGRFYVAGGQAGSGGSRSVATFDGLTWSELPDLPEGRAGAGAAALPDGRLAVFGGEIDGQLTDSTLVLEPGADDWVLGTPMPNPQADMAVAVLSGRAYLIGGSASDREPELLVFDFAGAGWTVQPMPFPLVDVAATTHGEAIYVVGTPAADGVAAEAASMYRFDPEPNVWTALSPPPVRPVAAVAAGGRIWAIASPDANHHGVAFYEPEIDAWTLTDEQLPPGRATIVIPSERNLIVIGSSGVGMTMTVIDIQAP
jgi:hypothetical protein